MADEPADPVDAITAQWAEQRPDLADLLPAMATIGRLGRVVTHVTKAIEANAAARGFGVGELDVLFALRRSGDPFELTPTVLGRTMMLSPAGVTGRVDRLERAGLVERRMDPDDRRSFLVRLTAEGLSVADDLVADHVALEDGLLAGLRPADRQALDRGLRRLLALLDAEHAHEP